MNAIKRVLLALVTLATTLSVSSAQENIITPAPNIAVWGETTFNTSKGLWLYIDAPAKERARLVAAAKELNLTVKESKRPAKRNHLNLSIVPRADIAEASAFKSFDEGYTLDITSKGIDIKATTTK